MIFAYAWSLVVFISMADGHHEVYVHQYATYELCALVEKDMLAGVNKTRNPETVVLGCRENLSLNLGTVPQLRPVAK